jgi:glycosyltransferase involved in cell wall biosynthesis
LTAEASAPAVSVVICTYRRVDGIVRAARSVLAQDCVGRVPIELVIVDNNADGRAEPVVRELQASAPIPVRYVHEPVASISRARNAGIRAAAAAHIAFLDDDEIAAPGWLAALIETARATGADLVFGPVNPIFEGGAPPDWDLTGSHYRTGLALPDGTVAPILDELGHDHALGRVGAGNVLIVGSCLDDPEPFDSAFGSSGGEDSDFFRRQTARGRRAAWSAKAVVEEHVPKARAELGFMVTRSFRESQTYVQFLVKNSRRPRYTARILALRGAAQAGLWALPRLLAPLLPRLLAVRARLSFARGMGKLLWRRGLRPRGSWYN